MCLGVVKPAAQIQLCSHLIGPHILHENAQEIDTKRQRPNGEAFHIICSKELAFKQLPGQQNQRRGHRNNAEDRQQKTANEHGLCDGIRQGERDHALVCPLREQYPEGMGNPVPDHEIE